MTFMSGPHVQAASFVDRVLHERDGVLSLVRMVDRVAVHAPPDAPDEIPEGATTKMTMVIMLKSGEALGRHRVTIRPEQPSGLEGTPHGVEVYFEGGDRGANLIVELDVALVEGLHWFRVELGDRELTRVPLRVGYQRRS